MKVFLEDVSSGKLIEALISKASKNDMPLRNYGWHFTWNILVETEGAEFYKLTKLGSPKDIEGILMLTLLNEEMLYMNNLEVAPHNYGSKGRLTNVAGCLLAFACYKSFELGKGYYLGYLSFDSKTELINLYQKKHEATLAVGQKMFFDPLAGKKLIKQYLNIKL